KRICLRYSQTFS
ncbi:survival SurE family protein, partial [Chlamydia psittaci 84-8471/1]